MSAGQYCGCLTRDDNEVLLFREEQNFELSIPLHASSTLHQQITQGPVACICIFSAVFSAGFQQVSDAGVLCLGGASALLL